MLIFGYSVVVQCNRAGARNAEKRLEDQTTLLLLGIDMLDYLLSLHERQEPRLVLGNGVLIETKLFCMSV